MGEQLLPGRWRGLLRGAMWSLGMGMEVGDGDGARGWGWGWGSAAAFWQDKSSTVLCC